jgi:hypothetical protein
MIDVYVEPLISNLKELWDVKVLTYDVSFKKTFTMHGIIQSSNL